MKNKKTGGRQKGTPNKITANIRQSFEEAFDLLQKDDKANLIAWAKKNTTEFYKLAAKLIPMDVNVGGQSDNPVSIKIEFVKPQ